MRSEKITNELRYGEHWKNGIMGVVTGDALGCPVEFWDKVAINENPVKGMRGYGTFNLPAGSWTDDSSLTLAALASICELGEIDHDDIMTRFGDWLVDGEYTPFGKAFDIGTTCHHAIYNYLVGHDASSCGGRDERDNGNGSLMRIMPACLYCYDKEKSGEMSYEEAMETIHSFSALTHAHLRAKMACGLYYNMVRSILDERGDLNDKLQKGLDNGFDYYKSDIMNLTEMAYFGRIRDLSELKQLPEDVIMSGGYVIETIEAVMWSLTNTDSFESALLKAVNLGFDTDTVGAIAGGLAALHYGYGSIPGEWLAEIQRREWIEGMISK